jgi:cellulose synthase/poly-beta-1,6-N-acetylglucosamine synthase-like glycosyltransferase
MNFNFSVEILRFSNEFERVVLVYFFALNFTYFFLMLIGFFELLKYGAELDEREDFGALNSSELVPPVSVLAPAYNEAATVIESVKAMLALSYPEFEVVVINDGSKDETLDLLIQEFNLYRSSRPANQDLPTKPIRGVYRSPGGLPLVVIDKENGGKADALNAGICSARYPLVCAVDSDSLLEETALKRVVLPFLRDPEQVLAVGGIVRIANGCSTSGGRVTEVALSSSWLVRFQVVEYLRAFLGGRVAFSTFNCLLVISGAFGLFRKSAVIAVGGYNTSTVGEDMELIVRIHRWARQQKKEYRVVFQPDPICWTEVPESLRVLKRQRNRWQRGTIETVWEHKSILFRPVFGLLGWIALPYFAIFEGIGPVIELIGYVLTAVGVSLGLFQPRIALLFFICAVVNGIVLSVSAVILEELSTKRYPKVAHMVWLVIASIFENFGYRQLTTLWRAQALWDILKGKKCWGVMERKGFGQAAAAQ